MKNILFVLLLVFSRILLAQTLAVEYEVSLNNLIKKGVLSINDSLSYYYEMPDVNARNKDIITTASDGSKIITLNQHEGEGPKVNFQVYPKNNEPLLTIDYLGNEKIIYREPYSKMIWKLEDETKTIVNYVAHKATTKFRGRTYTAWFTYQLPASVGPWKFNNLPGIILELTDDSKAFFWYATKISRSTDNLLKPDFDDKTRELSMQKFIEEGDVLKSELRDQTLLKFMGRGVEIVKKESIRSRELVYSWEE